MQLKASNKYSGLFISSIATVALILLFLSSSKKSKYSSTPVIEQKTTLDFIQVSLHEKHYNKLKKKRDKALSVGVLETVDTDYVPATIAFNGIDYKAEIRLKGDWTDHLKGEKWSFRVKLKGDKTILGMRKFSIHHPQTRGYINEWLYHKAIKDEGLMGLRYGFLEGAIHIKKENSSKFINKEVGIYAIEETFDKRTIESNGRKESVIVKYSENLWWNGVKKSIAVGEPSGLHWNNFNKSVKYPITVFSESKVLQDSTMFRYFKQGKDLLINAGRSIPISEAFDVKKLAMQNAVLNLFGASHGNSIINLRFYYNPITSKLEPISFDGNAGVKLRQYEHFNIVKRTKKDTLYEEELIKALNKVSKPEYLDNLFNTYKDNITNYEKILKKEFNIRTFSLQNLRHNQSVIKEEILRLAPDYKMEESIDIDKPVVANIALPEMSKWTYNEMSLNRTDKKYDGKNVYRSTRKTTSKPSYITVSNIKIKQGRAYKVSFTAKRGALGKQLGFRIQGVYPNRLDAVFNLESGLRRGFKNVGGFENPSAGIQSLGNGWYNCSVTFQSNSPNIRVVMGATNNDRTIESWEASIKEKADFLIIPSSLKLEEISN